ncbi:MAG: sulfate adenylyltransferase [Dehalococcoidia bacterium]|nr:sulfate adenylyltransferase [Dehalococcoidia bacterium]HRC61675.1 sulfate adenylyltransferase [Dehalococcoidia bacterium]
MPELIAPHGGRLNERLVTGDAAQALAERARSLKTVTLDARQVTDLELLAVGALSPLDGFMGKADYDRVIDEMHLASGAVWSVPVTLGVPAEEARALVGSEVALVTPDGTPLAVMQVAEAFDADRPREALKVYRTDDMAHPGVEAIFAQGNTLIGGSVQVFALPPDPEFPEYRLTPAQTRAYFEAQGWRTVVGFQTRNPVHRAHEYLQKVALETIDGLLLHPLVGETKEGDIPADVRMRCYRVLLDNYYPKDRVLLSVLPASMRYAGPREAIFHAIMRQNYGCSHFIVGRDHAGVGDYYGTYDAQTIFDELAPGELGITPLKFEHTFFCRACDSMASTRTCPHTSDHHVVLSGTKVRQMLAAGEVPPVEFSRPEVAQVLIDSMRTETASV